MTLTRSVVVRRILKSQAAIKNAIIELMGERNLIYID